MYACVWKRDNGRYFPLRRRRFASNTLLLVVGENVRRDMNTAGRRGKLLCSCSPFNISQCYVRIPLLFGARRRRGWFHNFIIELPIPLLMYFWKILVAPNRFGFATRSFPIKSFFSFYLFMADLQLHLHVLVMRHLWKLVFNSDLV